MVVTPCFMSRSASSTPALRRVRVRDEIDAVRRTARNPALDVEDSRLDGGKPQTARTQEPQKTGLRHPNDNVHRGNTLIHTAGEYG